MGFGVKLSVGPILAGFIAAATLVVVYLLLVVLASPTIPSDLALRLAVSRNLPYLGVVAGLSGVQAYLAVYSRGLPCRLGKTKAVGAGSSLIASFTSFFGLTSVGCCGLFPFWVSLVFGGGAFGLGASTFFVNYSTPLTIFGLLIMGSSIALTVRKIRRSLNGRFQVGASPIKTPPGTGKMGGGSR